MLTYERLREVLHYDPETGVFTWLKRSPETHHVKIWNSRWAGKVAGCPMIKGQYWGIGVDTVTHGAHRLAVLYMTGRFPEFDVDHKNGNGLDNRWSNLRTATRTQNCGNKKKGEGTSSHLKGVGFDKWDNRWKASIMCDGKRKHLGRFRTQEEAHAAYCRAADELFGEFARYE